MTVDIRNASYVPTIFLRQAELLAVRELPDSAKDILCPIFCLKPWATALQLSAAVKKIEAVFPGRQYFLDIDPFYEVQSIERPAHQQFVDLVNPQNGHQNWIKFFEEYPNAFPCIIAHHGDIPSIASQANAFSDKERVFLVRLNRENGNNFFSVIDAVCSVEHSNFGFVIDMGWSRDLLNLQGWADGLIKRIVDLRGDSIPIILTGSSFPEGFERYGLGEKVSVRERALFDLLKVQNNQAFLIYGDWASSRSPSEGGGGTVIPPRVDLATGRDWEIYRLNEQDGGFQAAAQAALKSAAFPKAAKIWSTYMIEATSLGDPNGIDSRQKAAAARINLHIYQQLYAAQQQLPFDTDDEYVE